MFKLLRGQANETGGVRERRGPRRNQATAGERQRRGVPE
jgi:hypothetical protein